MAERGVQGHVWWVYTLGIVWTWSVGRIRPLSLTDQCRRSVAAPPSAGDQGLCFLDYYCRSYAITVTSSLIKATVQKMKLLWPLTCWTLNPKPDP